MSGRRHVSWATDPEVEEHALLLRADETADAESERPRPAAPPSPRISRRQRAYAYGALFLVTIPLFLLFVIALLRHPDERATSAGSASAAAAAVLEHPDTFKLDAAFDRTAPPTTRVYRWTVSEVMMYEPGFGSNRTRVVVNGHSPGPLIQANQHDRVVVYVTNGLKGEGTSIHWHGLPQPGTPFYDGTPGVTQCPIPPGQTLVYNFTLGDFNGTTWWHGHSGVQHTEGLVGPIVVHSPTEYGSDARSKISDHIITITDNYADSAKPMLVDYLASTPIETTDEPVPDFAQINGAGAGGHEDDRGVYDEVSVPKGWTPTLRLVHAGSFAPMRISVDGHALTIVETDGTPNEHVQVRDLLIWPAQRYRVRLDPVGAAASQAVWVRAHMEDSAFSYDNLRQQPEARAILRLSSSSSSSTSRPTSHPGPLDEDKALSDWWARLPHFDEWTLRPGAGMQALPTSRDTLTVPFKFSIQRTSARNWRSFMNNTSWEIPPARDAMLVADLAGIYRGDPLRVKSYPVDQLVAAIPRDHVVDFVITNLDDGDHPFHFRDGCRHGYAPWLLGHGKGRFRSYVNHLDTTNPIRRDTFTVPARSWAVVRILTDNAGYWAFHCHISWHMAGGGIFQLAVPPAANETLTLPEDIVRHCRMWDK
ncbi:unnamed protein product [Mycena citricolor]|uniref:Multicopper oxidase n=1 Tax=Mycena citricolor TaxID=2018698 RepID=A0AAD2HIP4_9AGAR|nr:unnamed protein product [Mycena citricolor]